MANKRYTLNEAQNFVNSIGKQDLAGILYQIDNFKGVVRTLANKNDKPYFNKLMDEYFNLVNSNGGKSLKNGAYEMLEMICYSADGKIMLEKSKIANLYDWFMSREGKAVKLYKKYLKKIEIKHNTENYSPKEVYKKIDSLSNGLARLYINLVPNLKKSWNGRRNRMNFNFKVDDFNVRGNVILNKNELILNGKIPLAAKLYKEEITKDIKKKLEKTLPKLPASE
jgi:hypothetical protein